MPLTHIKYALTATEVVACLAKIDGWMLSGDGAEVVIEKAFTFADFAQTMTFVNFVAWLSQAQNHHPELLVQVNRCVVRYRTHDVAGISRADFECATRIDALYGKSATCAAHP